MDSQLNYRQIIKNTLQEYVQHKPVNVDVTSALSFDDEQGVATDLLNLSEK